MTPTSQRVPTALRVAVTLLPRDVREEVLGDLVEAWQVRRRRHGRAAAHLWTWRQPAAALVSRYAAATFTPRAGLGRAVGDLRVSARSLTKTPSFTVVTVAMLGVAIGANTAIFSVVDAVLLDPFAFAAPDRLVSIRGSAPGSVMPAEFELAPEFYLQYRDGATGLEDVAYYLDGEQTVRANDLVERLPVLAVSPSLYTTLGVRPILGRAPTEQDEDATVVVLSHWLWTDWFGADPEVIGRTIEVAGGPRTVIGVMGPNFGFPHERIALWFHDLPSEQIRPGAFGWAMVGRLAPDADSESLASQLAELAARIPDRFGGSAEYVRIIERHRPIVRPLEETLVGDIAAPLWILMGTAAIVLLVACANVANMLLARAEDRRRSLAVRRALGATRGDLVRAQMIETLVVAALGGALGSALALGGIPLLVRAAPEGIPRLATAGLDWTALAFTMGIVLLAALVAGLLPALRFSSPALDETLSDRMRVDTRANLGLRNGLVVAQSAAAVVLLVGSVLLLRSFVALNQVDPGYDTDDIFTFQMAPDLRTHGISDAPGLARFHYAFLDRLAALPDVEAVGLSLTLPLDERGESVRIITDDISSTGAPQPLVQFTHIGGEYFRAMGIDLLAGRTFERNADITPEPRVILSESAAHLLWPDEDPLDKRLRLAGGDSLSSYLVAGVVEDVILEDFRRTEPEPLIYLPLVGRTRSHWPITTPAFVVKSPRSGAMGPEVRNLVREIAPEAPVYHMSTMAALAARALGRLTFTMLTLGVAAAIAIVLGAGGLYGALSYVVSQRTREIGIRMALGARAAGVRRAVVAQGTRVALAGVVLGVIASAALARALDSLLFGVAPVHVPTYAMTAGLMLGVALLASYIPARRASSVDPMRALRAD